MTNYFCFKSELPTQTNLAVFLSQRGWCASRFAWRATVNDDWLAFPIEISETLEYKHQLAHFCQQTGMADVIPTTISLDDNNWHDVVDYASRLEWGRYILKPALLNNGQHIQIFDRPESLMAYFLTGKRMGGPHVLQRYIEPPHLIQGPQQGHKYSIRQLIVLSTHAGCGLFPKGYLNIALKPYHAEIDDLTAHLTNEHLSHERVNVVQRLSDEMAVYQPFADQIVAVCQQLCDALRLSFPNQWQTQRPLIGCFGVDFMVDAQEKLWLLEVNHGPCFPTDSSHPLYQTLYTPFWHAVIDKFIEGNSSEFIDI